MPRTRLALATAVALGVSSAALGGTLSVTQSGLSDAQLGQFIESDVFVAEARVGDSGGAAQKEAILTGPGGFRSESNVNLGGEGALTAASFVLSHVAGDINFSLNGVGVPTALSMGDLSSVDGFAIRLRGDRTLGDFDYGATLSGLTFDGMAVNGFSDVTVDNGGINPGVASLILTGADFTADWTLAGTITFVADELRGAGVGSNPAMQIKAIEMPVIPLPAPGVLAAAGLCLVGLQRRR